MYLLGGVIFKSSAGNALPVFYLTLHFGSFVLTVRGGHACIHVPTVMQNMYEDKETNSRVFIISPGIKYFKYF